MTFDKMKELKKQWRDLSMVCWCRGDSLCSACRSQDAIKAECEAAGWNMFTEKKK